GDLLYRGAGGGESGAGGAVRRAPGPHPGGGPRGPRRPPGGTGRGAPLRPKPRRGRRVTAGEPENRKRKPEARPRQADGPPVFFGETTTARAGKTAGFYR